MISNKNVILEYLKNKSITSIESFDKYGITRLAAVIKNLRDDGYNIDTIMHKAKNRRGKNIRYAEYVLATPQLNHTGEIMKLPKFLTLFEETCERDVYSDCEDDVEAAMTWLDNHNG